MFREKVFIKVGVTVIDSRLKWILASGAGIAVLCGLRLLYNFPHDFHRQLAEAKIVMPSPLFETVDQDNRLVTLRSFLGRHEIMLIFFDPDLGPLKDPAMVEAIQHSADPKRRGIKVFAISPRLPQQNRKDFQEQEPPFPLLSDPALEISNAWGLVRADQRIEPAVFLINRAGNVPSNGKIPRPARDAATAIKELTR